VRALQGYAVPIPSRAFRAPSPAPSISRGSGMLWWCEGGASEFRCDSFCSRRIAAASARVRGSRECQRPAPHVEAEADTGAKRPPDGGGIGSGHIRARDTSRPSGGVVGRGSACHCESRAAESPGASRPFGHVLCRAPHGTDGCTRASAAAGNESRGREGIGREKARCARSRPCPGCRGRARPGARTRV